MPKRFAEGKPKALNAPDKQQLARLKKAVAQGMGARWERERESAAER